MIVPDFFAKSSISQLVSFFLVLRTRASRASLSIDVQDTGTNNLRYVQRSKDYILAKTSPYMILENASTSNTQVNY